MSNSMIFGDHFENMQIRSLRRQRLQIQWSGGTISTQSHTFVVVDHEIIYTVILPIPLIHSRRVVVSYEQKYVHELLVNHLFKLA